MIKQVDGVQILPRHRASCHCGAVELELELPDGIVDPRRCDCSICRRKGAVVASVHWRAIGDGNVFKVDAPCMAGIWF